MDAQIREYIEENPELDIAIRELVEYWKVVQRERKHGKTGIALGHTAGRFNGTLHPIKEWTKKVKI